VLASYLLRSEKNLSAKNDNWSNMATAAKYLTMDFGNQQPKWGHTLARQ